MKNKRKWILGGIAATLLVIALVLGSSTSYLGAFKAVKSTTTTTKTPSLVSSSNGFHLNSVGIASTGGYLYFEICWDSSSTTDKNLEIDYKFQNTTGDYTKSYATLLAGSGCQTTTITLSVYNGWFTSGDTYVLDVIVLDATTGTSETNDKTTYSFVAPDKVSVSDIAISDDYENFTASICELVGVAGTLPVTFATNTHTADTGFEAPTGGSCSEVSVDVDDFGTLYPRQEYTLTVNAGGTEESATFTIIPDIEVRDAGLDGDEFYAEVCGYGNVGDEIGTVRFTVFSSDGGYDTLIESKYAGIGTMPTGNTCETVTVELTNEELGSIVEGGSYLEALVEYSIGGGDESNSFNNTFFYFF